LRPILRRVSEWPFVLEHLAEIAAIDPTAARGTTDEMLGLLLRRLADKPTEVSAARNHQRIAFRSSCAS
jgi:hypothetical protein